MSILNMLGGGDGIERLARQLGIDPSAADGLAKMLAPAIGSAAKKRAEAGGLDNVLTELKGEGNARFFDEPEAAATDDARADGENFLANILGSREATRNVAEEAAARSGIATADVEKFLPSLAAMVKGGMQKQTPDSAIDGIMGQLKGGGGGIMGAITGMMGGGGGDKESDASVQYNDTQVTSGSGDSFSNPMDKEGTFGAALDKESSFGAAHDKDSVAAAPQDKEGGGIMGGLAGGLLGGLMGGDKSEDAPAAGGDSAGGFDLSSLSKMLDADGDGSPLDDVLERIMKK